MAEETLVQLLIIGNGFDLEAGLKSGYADFNNHRYDTKLRDVFSKLTNFNFEEQYIDMFSFWDIIFLSKEENGSKYNRWSDIESELKLYLQALNKSDFSLHDTGFFSQVDKNLNNWTLLEQLEKDEWKPNFEDLSYRRSKEQKMKIIDKKIRESNPTVAIVALFIKKKYGTSSELYKSNKTVFYENILRMELFTYEQEFKKYLDMQLAGNANYYLNTDQILHRIIWDGVQKSDSTNYFNSILSFNYTEPFIDRVETYHIHKIKNVHGTLRKGDLIFGIDFHNNENNSGSLEFTKTFRTMKIIERDSQKNIFDFDVDIIRFYGHSLSEADYSYFVSLFDTVDLYHSKTKLIFYYKNLKPKRATIQNV